MFPPIAIVGQGCVLPGALSPRDLWDAVAAGRDLTSDVAPGHWRIDPDLALCKGPEDAADRTWSDRGGYVRGFEQVFDPTGFAVPADALRGLDPVFLWLLHSARQALGDLGRTRGGARAGAVIGNLSFPSAGMGRLAESLWLGDPALLDGRAAELAGVGSTDPRNRFDSGLPAHLVAAALDLGAGAYALDAACASSLYAIKHACDMLHDGRADLMLAGAVNCADDLFIHTGFCALMALSRTGQSRPFHAEADGLLPAEGAALVALERLEDAVRSGHRILGVIRGVGVSNDGRGRGFLVPDADAQERAIRAAYEMARIDPATVSLLECHATGTAVGDGAEIVSSARVFHGARNLPIGSLKSNTGHLITAAGAAGLIKVLGAMATGVRPATLHTEQPLPALSDSPFRLLDESEPWDGVRRAGISAFGFGGNNAHLVVEEWTGDDVLIANSRTSPPEPCDLAVVALGARVGTAGDAAAFAAAIADGRSLLAADGTGRIDEVALDLRALRFPPLDLQQALAQQTLLLAAARDAVGALDLPRDRTGVMVGMQCDAEIARYGLRWRLPQHARNWAGHGVSVPGDWVSTGREAATATLLAAGVIGTMPNIPANRLNSQFDLAGSGHTVSSEELSGVRALEIASRALRAGEWDAAVVGAVDLSCEPVHRAALDALNGPTVPGDAAVVLVLERLDDARRAGHPVLAVLSGVDSGAAATWRLARGDSEVTRLTGHAHAASGLVHVAAAVAACAHGRAFGKEVASIDVEIEAVLGQSSRVHVRRDAQSVAPPATAANSGRLLRLPAHPAPVHLPPLSTQRAPAVSAPARPVAAVPKGYQAMPPAPPLPSVLDDVSAFAPAPVAPAPAAASVVHAARPFAPSGPSPRVAEAPAGSDPFTRHQARIASAHRAFLESQSAVHAEFMAHRQRSVAALFGAGGAVTVAPAAEIPRPALQPRGVPTAPAPVPVAAPARVETPAPAAPAPPVTALPTEPPVVAPATPTSEPPAGVPSWNRQELEVHAGGRISSIFGPAFEPQDRFEVQVRMPEPPLLLCDRVTGITGEPTSMGKGSIWTETDVTWDSWYLHQGAMPGGIMIESGQADLMLISYLGVDLLNRGERAYRLLGCDLTYHGPLPVPGETLRYDIHVDGHANQGDVRLFFFHYDCHIDGVRRLSVRGGQAGFFTIDELNASAGVLWDAKTGEHCETPRLDPPRVETVARELSGEQLQAFADGRPWDCFGAGFEYTMSHTRTPCISGGRMLFLERVTDISVDGGPWGRGYLRAVDDIRPDDWFFAGHFKNDPCMPGTLMFEGCLQAMVVYLAALGYTIDKDGWRFEPVAEELYKLRCRGQVIPTSRELVYEIFVEEVVDGPIPTLYADLLCTVDGLKAFHCRRMGLQLSPNWPLTSRPEVLRDYVEPKPVAIANGHAFDFASLLACAWGRPTDAFGPLYAAFDGPRRVPRLPGPPYHFMSRVLRIDGEIGGLQPGTKISVEYDVPQGAWYFDDNGCRTMPYAVLLEAGLQPCGWLASYVGSAAHADRDLMFRNLDGTSTLTAEVFPASGTLRTEATIKSISKSSGMIIESFDVACYVGETRVFAMDTVFGFFPPEAFDNQAGLPIAEHHRAVKDAASDFVVDLTERPARYCGGEPRLAGTTLLMLDRVTGYWPEGGRHGRGALRAEKDVDPAEWFFKSHFFQDPVQPGSLGLEAMLQLLQFHMLHTGLADGIPHARFEPLALDVPMTWKYRGQVVPRNHLITTTMDIVETGRDERGAFAIAEAALWVDGTRIYEASNIGMRIVAGEAAPAALPAGVETLDPSVDTWLGDHRPTWTVPALPMMSMVDRLAAAATPPAGDRLVALRDVQVKRWLVVDGPTHLRTDRAADGTLTLLADDGGEFAPVATATAEFATAYASAPAPLPPLADGVVSPSPYTTGELFHGPAFHVLESLVSGSNGASAVLDAGVQAAPLGHLHQVLLDGATHAIPHDDLARWCPDIPRDQVAYPAVVEELLLHGPTPTSGDVRCEVRFDGFARGPRFPAFRVQLAGADGPWISFRLVEALFPKGRIGVAAPADRRAFLADRAFVPGLRLSRVEDGASRLALADLRAISWLPGTVESLYATSGTLAEMAEEIVVKEHVAEPRAVHPCTIDIVREGDVCVARRVSEPLWSQRVAVHTEGAEVVATGAAGGLDLSPVRDWWRAWFGLGQWPVEDLFFGLIQRFVRNVHIEDPAAWEAVRGRSLLYLGNHQVGAESLLFSILAAGLSHVPTVTLAKIEHRATWLGELIAHSFTYPGSRDPGVITFFDRENKADLPRILGELAAEMAAGTKSVMVHVEGTRSLSCTQPVQKMSGAFVDMALKVGAPVVPVRFTGGLPREDLTDRLEFPLGHGTQDIWIGTPILPEDLAKRHYGDRKATVVEAINALGPSNAVEQPNAPDAAFEARVHEHMQRTGASPEHAVLRCVLAELPSPCADAALLAAGERPTPGTDPARAAWVEALRTRLWG